MTALNTHKIKYLINQFNINKTKHSKKAIILLYHNIGLPTLDEKHKGMFVSLLMFKFQMWYLKKAGFKVVSLETIYKFIKMDQPNDSHEKLIALTFDDGYEDFYKNAFPVLKANQFPATVFLISEHINKINDWSENKSSQKKILNWDQINEMRNHNISFGSHTKNHYPLSSLTSEQIFKELFESKKDLELQLGEVNFFAYPYGDHNESTYKEVIRAGYKSAFTSDRGVVLKNDDEFKLKRLNISLNNFPLYFIRKVNSAYKN